MGSITIGPVAASDCGLNQVVILDNLSRGTLRNVHAALQDPRVTFVRGDIRDTGLVRRRLS